MDSFNYYIYSNFDRVRVYSNHRILNLQGGPFFLPDLFYVSYNNWSGKDYGSPCRWQMDSDLEAPLGCSDWVPYYNISHNNILTTTSNNNANNNSIDEEKAGLEMIGTDRISPSFWDKLVKSHKVNDGN